MQIAGKGLKAAFDSASQGQDSQASLHEHSTSKNAFTTSIDDETGNVKIKALPYTQNPKLRYVTTRQDYFENGIIGEIRKPTKNTKKQNARRSVGADKFPNKKPSSQNVSKSNSKHNMEMTPFSMRYALLKFHLYHSKNTSVERHQITEDSLINSPILMTNFDDTIDALRTNRTQKVPSFLPSIRVSSHQARKLLFENPDYHNHSMHMNRSMIESAGEGADLHNLSVQVISNAKKKSPIPTNRNFRMSMTKISDFTSNDFINDMQNNRRSTGTSGTGTANVENRLIDYKNMKNNRFNNLSVHEQFNLDILGNSDNWGESVHLLSNYSFSQQSDSKKPVTTKYQAVSKHAIVNDSIVTKRRMLNFKRRDQLNYTLQAKGTVGYNSESTYGHNKLKKKIDGALNATHNLDIADVGFKPKQQSNSRLF